jgi:pimeloyl-ACP methyl ester carboxylesterase
VIAPDLRGHGDSQWMLGGTYLMIDYIYDIAQLVSQKKLAPVTIIGHSLGGAISLHYSGTYPETVKKLIAIEGLGPPPQMWEERARMTPDERLRDWIGQLRGLAGRLPRRYASIEEAFRRMLEENKHLTPEQARYLTVHGVNQNEDGTYSWKFDNYVRAFPPVGLSLDELHHIWGCITCPTLLVRGTESWAQDPEKDGRLSFFQNARVVNVEGAGHWVHHDRLDEFLELTRDFLAE